MIELKLVKTTPGTTLEMVQDLKLNGYVVGVDFDFAYHQPTYNNDGWEMVEDRYTMFTFYREEISTWFGIKWIGTNR